MHSALGNEETQAC